MASLETVLQSVNSVLNTQYKSYRPQQREILMEILNGKRDCVAMLATGGGKTLIYHSILFSGEMAESKMLLISPLNAIIEKELKALGSLAVSLTECMIEELQVEGQNQNAADPKLQRIMKGEFRVLVGHPEVLTHPVVVRNIIRFQRFQFLVVDEAHCLLHWGGDDFRPAFLKVQTLRSVLPQLRCLALTATATDSDAKKIGHHLRMVEPAILRFSPDRENVLLGVARRPPSSCPEDSFDSVIDPLIEELRIKGLEMEKTVVFVRAIKWAGYGHYRVCRALLNPPVHLLSKPLAHPLVSQYHAAMNPERKAEVMVNFSGGNGCRMLFATEAFGMGVDIPDIARVVHIGPPRNMETYAQQLGRCGRDGRPSKAVVHFNNTDVKNVDDAVKDFCTTEACRRSVLLGYFGFTKDENPVCCDNCEGLAGESGAQITSAPVKRVLSRLCALFSSQNKCLSDIDIAKRGMSDSLAHYICDNLQRFQSFDELLEDLQWLDREYVSAIYKIISYEE